MWWMKSGGRRMRLIIGYGNPLRCDDRLGQYLAQRLEACWDGITCITAIQLTPELAEPISRADQVVFLDAGVGDSPGAVICQLMEPAPAEATFTHHVTPQSLLAGAHLLYGTYPSAILISVTAVSFDYNCRFSPQVDALLPQIIAAVEQIVTAFFTAQDMQVPVSQKADPWTSGGG